MIAILIQPFDTAALIVVLLTVVVAGWVIVALTLRHWVRTELDQLSMSLYEHIQIAQEQLQKVAEEMQTARAAQPRGVAECNQVEGKITAEPSAGPAKDAALEPGAAAPEAPSPEELAVIAAAVVEFAGEGAVIQGIKPASGTPAPSWAHQGRVHVHSSHNVFPRRVA